MTTQQPEGAALAELAAVCDAYGLPHSAVALDRHLTGNAAATIDAWKATVDLLQQRLDEAHARIDRVLDMTEWYCDDDHQWQGHVGLRSRLHEALGVSRPLGPEEA